MTTFDDLVGRSAALPYRFPVGPRNRLADVCVTIAEQEEAAEFARAVRPIVHTDVLELFSGFLDVKRAAGSATERTLYAGLDVPGLVDRLLHRRALVFCGASDAWRLTTGETGAGGFESVGTDDEQPPLILSSVLAYDEIALSALLGVSVPTRFVNRGDRQNLGRPAAPGTFVRDGIYVGLVGARFERLGVMEWRHLMVTPEQNQPDVGPPDPLLALWARFYGHARGFPTYARAVGGEIGRRYLDLGSDRLLDVQAYARRLRLVVEPFLFEACARARESGRKAYAHVVGLGLGVWGVHHEQASIMTDVYAEVLADHPRIGTWISDLDFSWFPSGTTCGGIRDGGRVGDVTIHFSGRAPADPIEEKRLVVAMYAWDGNSYPGNEYWEGALAASGDPAAAGCSMIAELQNPDVNPAVAARNLRSYPAE